MAKRMVQISVNIVGEYAALDEELAQPLALEFDDVQEVLEQANLPPFREPQDSIAWGPADNARQYDERLSVLCLHALRGAYAAMKLVRSSAESAQPIAHPCHWQWGLPLPASDETTHDVGHASVRHDQVLCRTSAQARSVHLQVGIAHITLVHRTRQHAAGPGAWLPRAQLHGAGVYSFATQCLVNTG